MSEPACIHPAALPMPADPGSHAVIPGRYHGRMLTRLAALTEVLLEKYAKGDEATVADVHRRVARALAAGRAGRARAHWERASCRRWSAASSPAGRIQSAGRHRRCRPR
jgi:hypothetical protein